MRLTSASDMLADLAAQDGSAALARRLRRYSLTRLLCIDEVEYRSYSNCYADLLFEVVTRRYDQQRSIVISTNNAFAEWSEVFPHAACTVTLVGRLVHRSEILEIDGATTGLRRRSNAPPSAPHQAAASKPRPDPDTRDSSPPLTPG